MSDLKELACFAHRVRLLLRAEEPDLELLQQAESTLHHCLQQLQNDTDADDQTHEEFKQLSLSVDALVGATLLREDKDSSNERRKIQQPEGLEEQSVPLLILGGKVKDKKGALNDVSSSEVEQQQQQSSGQSSAAEKIQTLLLQQKDLSTQALEEERRSHAQLAAEVSSLTSALKDATLSMNRSVVEQNIHLDSLQTVATENQAELDKQQKRSKEQAKVMFTSVWTSVGSVVWIVSLFVITYIVIRIFPKP